VAVQVTPLFDEPVTVAVNVWVVPACTDAEVGLMVIDTTGAAAVRVTDAAADFDVSATLVAVTLNVPAEFPAAYIPVDEIVPPVADQVTFVLDDPVTVAENCCLPATCREAEVGLMLTATVGAAATVTDAVADFVASATLVAVTLTLPALLPAVYIPVDETFHALADHMTLVFDVPVTSAENCCLPLG